MKNLEKEPLADNTLIYSDRRIADIAILAIVCLYGTWILASSPPLWVWLALGVLFFWTYSINLWLAGQDFIGRKRALALTIGRAVPACVFCVLIIVVATTTDIICDGPRHFSWEIILLALWGACILAQGVIYYFKAALAEDAVAYQKQREEDPEKRI